MFTLRRSTKIKKDFKLCVKRNWDMSLLFTAINILEEKGKLPKEYISHPLIGQYKGYIDSHICPDWVLIWKINGNEIFLYRTGTHSDLFG
ncbi:addiction module toxin, RelE/StbE family [Bacteroidia bacterium]|nr:addiction module toxin, RelE/StbE family [Bacteroidia bacterium]